MAEIPVYITAGFLESGKTEFIKGILEDYDFTERQKSLVIACEEGIEEYEPVLLAEANSQIVYVEESEQLTEAYFTSLAKKYRPKMIFIEFNGMWDLQKLMNELPDNMPVVQIFTLIDAGTYDSYITNMRSIIMNFIKLSDVVIVNRCTAATKKASIRRTVKGANARCAVMYENADGVSSDEVEDDLPFDITKNPIEIEEADFGVWYLDVMENPAKYAGKNVHFKSQVYYDDQMPKGFFYAGRYAMTCCEADIQYVGVMVRWKGAEKLPYMGFVNVTGKVYMEANEMYTAPGPVVTATEVLPAKKPEDKLVYFN